MVYMSKLIYNVVLISALQQNDSSIYVCIHYFSYFSIMIYHRLLNIVPCVRILLFIHTMYNIGLLLLIPNFQSTPPLPFLLGNHKDPSFTIAIQCHLCHKPSVYICFCLFLESLFCSFCLCTYGCPYSNLSLLL